MVNIPRLKQISETSTLPVNDRIQANVKSQASNIVNQTGAVASLAGKAADIHQSIEDSTINQVNNDADLDYTGWYNSKMETIKGIEGDPTEAYANFEKEEQEKYDEILAKRPDMSERVQRHLKANLGRTRSAKRAIMLSQRGAQDRVYKKKLHNSTIKAKKDDLSVNAGFINPNDQGAFLPYDQNINDIQTTIAKRSLENGMATKLPSDAESFSFSYPDADGEIVKVSMGDLAKREVAKELGEGIKASIENVTASGHTETSKIMLERYKDYLDPKSYTDLSNDLKDETETQEAHVEAARIERVPLERQEIELKKIKDPGKRSKVEKVIHTNTTRRNARTKQRQDTNYDAGMNIYIEMKKTGQVHGLPDLLNNPAFKKAYHQWSPKQKKAIQEEFDAPSKSDPKVMNEAYEILNGEHPDLKPENMTIAQFREHLVGANETDKRQMSNKFLSRKNKTQGEASAKTYNRAAKMLKRKLLIRGITKKDGKTLDEQSELKLQKSNDRISEWLEDVPGSVSEKELGEHIDALIEQLKAEELFGSSWFGTAAPRLGKPVREAVVTGEAPTGDILKGMTKPEITRLQLQYNRRHKPKRPIRIDSPAFLKYVESLK